jgi:hypothetical protein
VLIKFIDDNRHSYSEIKDESLIDNLKAIKARHVFLLKDGDRYEYVGEIDGVHTFRKADIVELKLKQYASKLVRANKIHYAESILKTLSTDKETINDFIKDIGIPKSSSKLQQIKEIKNKEFLYPKDEAYIKVLWWEAKREALRDKMQRLNLEIPSEREQSFLAKVVDELSDRITKSIKQYRDFPDLTAASGIKELFRIASSVSSYPNIDGFRTEEFRRIAGVPKGFGSALDKIFDAWQKFNHMERMGSEIDLDDLRKIYKDMEPSLEIEEYWHKSIREYMQQVKDFIDKFEEILLLIEQNDVIALEERLEEYSKYKAGLFPQIVKFMNKEVEKYLREIRNTNNFAMWLIGGGKYREMAEKLK